MFQRSIGVICYHECGPYPTPSNQAREGTLNSRRDRVDSVLIDVRSTHYDFLFVLPFHVRPVSSLCKVAPFLVEDRDRLTPYPTPSRSAVGYFSVVSHHLVIYTNAPIPMFPSLRFSDESDEPTCFSEDPVCPGTCPV